MTSLMLPYLDKERLIENNVNSMSDFYQLEDE